MFALLILALTAAFPQRGFVSQKIASDILLDRDTVRMNSLSLAMGCAGTSYSIDTFANPRLKIDSFPGHPFERYFLNILENFGGCLGTRSGPIKDFHFPKYVIQGHSGWALWVDTAWTVSSSTGSIFQSNYQGWVRWRWSRIDGSPAWVRWTDTIHLATAGTFDGSVPLLSLLKATPVDSVVPARENRSSPAFGQNLTLRRDTSAVQGALSWSSTRNSASITRTKTWSTLPMGSTIYVTNAQTDSAGVHLWRIWSGGAVKDSFWVERPSPAGLRARPASPRSPGGSWTINGRRRTELPLWSPRFRIGETGSIGGTK
jgi:hypothetical protein